MGWLLLLVAACKAAPSPPMLSNHAIPQPVSCKLTGTLVDAVSGERLAGATLELTSENVDYYYDQIADENGRFAYGDEALGLDLLTIYYNDMEAKRRITRCGELIIALWLQAPR